MEPGSYVYLLVVGSIIAFADGYGIGANDVANSFSTSVGSRSLTLKQACGIAVFTEFLGAFLLGANTAETIRGKIINVNLFVDKPEVLMLAMVCALIGSSSWIIFASSKGWPVSTTHSIVGAIIGVGVSAFGTQAIDWGYNGVGKIVASWFISPVVAGVVASLIFISTKYAVLRSTNSFNRGIIAVPIYFGITIAVNVSFFIYKGAPAFKLDKTPPVIIAPVTIGVTLIVSAFSYFFYAEWLRRKIIGKETGLRWYHIPIVPCIKKGGYIDQTSTESGATSAEKTNNEEISENPDGKDGGDKIEEDKEVNWVQKSWVKILAVAGHGLNKEIADYNHDKNEAMHAVAVKYDDDTETLYSFLQILTASFASFSHGSNDVANAVGPLATIYLIYTSGAVDPTGVTPVPIWILALGGIAIDIGLITYGYHVMRSLGNEITYHSPSRGFSMELGTSLTVLTASKLGLPVSTTHCITGATAGVGLCNGNVKALNWKLLAWCFFSWVLTLPIAGCTAGLIFAFVANAPKIGLAATT
ncbi:57_t:CDS:2 [Entrophospora sp. SA101]|nr:57_t:CDS:2 [Entrophospora sp. SA101]CAJ0828054.1 110_t:CDS:2 [Entrophospora sp. SA101]